jgi:hypothetical protein
MRTRVELWNQKQTDKDPEKRVNELHIEPNSVQQSATQTQFLWSASNEMRRGRFASGDSSGFPNQMITEKFSLRRQITRARANFPDPRTTHMCKKCDSENWPPQWSCDQSSWLQLQRSGFDSRRYHIFWKVVGLERSPLSLVGTIEELLERISSGSGLENQEYSSRRSVTLTTRHVSIGKNWH